MHKITHATVATIITLALSTPLLAFAQTTYTYPYPVGSMTNPLACTPATQNVSVGAMASFSAQGGFGTFTWITPERSYANIGPTFNTVFTRPGSQTVVVSSGSQSATCAVNVIGGVSAAAVPVQLATSYVPSALPNTGAEPLTAGMLFSALILLSLSALLIFPYAKKALATTLR